jgi:predicted lipid-binding transport protein (Tim44 family)
MTVFGIVIAVILLMNLMRMNNVSSLTEGFSSGSGFGTVLLFLLFIGVAFFLFKGKMGPSSSAKVHPEGSLTESQNSKVNAAASKVEAAAERMANANTPAEVRAAASAVTKAAAQARNAAKP